MQKRKGAKSDLGLSQSWPGAIGLAEDVRYYGGWMREEAQERVGHLYPPVEVTAAMAKQRPDLKPLVGQKLTVIAYLWARTVKSPNPAFSHVDVVLASTFVLSKREGKEAYLQPIVTGDSYRFTVKLGHPPAEAENGTKLSRGANFRSEGEERGGDVGGMRGGAPFVPEDRVLAMRAGLGVARVAAVQVARKLQAPVPAARGLEQVAADRSHRAELRRGSEAAGLT